MGKLSKGQTTMVSVLHTNRMKEIGKQPSNNTFIFLFSSILNFNGPLDVSVFYIHGRNDSCCFPL